MKNNYIDPIVISSILLVLLGCLCNITEIFFAGIIGFYGCLVLDEAKVSLKDKKSDSSDSECE